jgi:hypothetical protein
VRHHRQDFSGTVVVVYEAQKLTNSQRSNSAKTLEKKMNVQAFDPATWWQVDPFPRRGFDEGGLS